MSTPGQRIWREQCDAARSIKQRFGTQKALGYLIGEKLLNYLRAASARPDLCLAEDLPSFVAEIRAIFEPYELHAYLAGVRRPGALVMGDDQFAEFREAGAVAEDVVTAAEDVLYVERMKVLLLDRK
jgi:hypothetical protein